MGEFAQMMREESEGLPIEWRPDTPASEDFTASMTRRGALAHQGGWDPYEVWRTRVKTPSVEHHQDEERPRARLPALK